MSKSTAVNKPNVASRARRLINTFYRPNWHRQAVGGLWEEIGKLQFDFLVAQGLKPCHYFLDVGCGSLRAGVHFTGYLEAYHYYGVDINQKLLNAGRQELKQHRISGKNPNLVAMDNFDFPCLETTFDYAIANSVFTHLPFNCIRGCIVNIDKVLAPKGLFYATFFENPGEKFDLQPVLHPQADGPGIVSFYDRDPYYYDLDAFKFMCEGTSLEVNYIGHWNHPRNQKMLVFTKRAS